MSGGWWTRAPGLRAAVHRWGRLLCRRASAGGVQLWTSCPTRRRPSYIEGRLRLAEKEHHRRRQQQPAAAAAGGGSDSRAAPAAEGGGLPAGDGGPASQEALQEAAAAADAVMQELLKAELEEKVGGGWYGRLEQRVGGGGDWEQGVGGCLEGAGAGGQGGWRGAGEQMRGGGRLEAEGGWWAGLEEQVGGGGLHNSTPAVTPAAWLAAPREGEDRGCSHCLDLLQQRVKGLAFLAPELSEP